MAEAILFNATADIILKLGSSAFREFGLFWGVNDELDKLKHSLSAIQAVLHDAEQQQSKNSQVKAWISRLKDALYEIEDLMDECTYETLRKQVLAKGRRNRKQVRILFSKFKSNWKMGHKMKEMRQRLQAINDDKNEFSFSERVIIEKRDDKGLRKRRETYSYIPEEEVIGRNVDKEVVIDLLLNSNTTENVAVISIVGMGGLGKTALAQSIYTHHDVTNSGFQLKLWVCVSEEFDVKIIIQKIIESATGKKPESFLQIDSLQNELRKQIDGKKYLLIMDDVWNEKKEEWLRLKRLLMGGAKGSRILITTRSEQVAKTFDTTFFHSLQNLDASNSWLLFQKMTGLKRCPDNQAEFDQKNSNLIQIGKEIMSRLKGVPLVIRIIGGLLKDNKSERFWLSFKDKELYQVLGQEQDDLKEMRLILELSYKYLPANLKQCYLYCALFPKDYEIQKDELILLWRAQGFIQLNDNNDDNLIDIGDDYFMELLSRSFFQEVTKNDYGDIKACKIHDLMHDLACSITNNECVHGLKGNVIHKRTHHFSWEKCCHVDQLLGPLSKVMHLRTFFMLDGAYSLQLEKIIHNFFRLRTLRLNLLGNIPNAKLLEFIGNLKHLRYLRITKLRVKDLPNSITNLYNLEIFILQEANGLEKLPRDIKKFINLKHLDLSNNINLEILPDSITELCKLEALILYRCGNLKELPEDTKRLINLKHLDLRECSALTHMPKGLGELTNLQTMNNFLLGKNKGGELNELDGLTKLRGTLCIQNLQFCTSVDPQRKAKFLQLKSGLQELLLSWIEYDDPTIGELDDVIYESVLDCLQPHSNLRKISINNYNGVKLCHWVSSNSLGCLVSMRLHGCQRLQHLPQFDQFPNLKHLNLQNLPNIEYFMVNNDDSSVSSSTFFPSLEELIIVGMPKLERWWKDTTSMNSPIIFPCLSGLVIFSCPLQFLTSWHAPNYLKSFSIHHSKEVSLDVVPWKIFENLTLLYLSGLKKLEYLPECWQHYMTPLQQLSLCFCKNLKILPEWIGNLTSLTKLEISCCDKLTLLPEGIGDLTSLIELRISYCEKLTLLPKGICHINGLQYLSIIGCPILKERCQKDTGEDWPKIAHIPNLQITW